MTAPAAASGCVSSVRPYHAVTASPAAQTRAKCGNGARCCASSPPSAAPASPPKLHAAWNDGITGRRSAATTLIARLFIDTFRLPYAAPNTRSASPSDSADLASGGSSSATDSRIALPTVIRPAPNRRQSAPEIVMVAMAPPDSPSSASPSTAGDACVAALTAGIRTAQVAKTKPSTAKNAVAAARTLVIS